MSIDTSHLVAEALVEELDNQLDRSRGVIYYSPPLFDPDHFIESFADQRTDVGVAFVGFTETPTTEAVNDSPLEIRTTAKEGVKWRNAESNSTDVPSNLVFLVRGEQTSTNSIQDIHGVRDFDGEPLRRLWKIGAQRLDISLDPDAIGSMSKVTQAWQSLLPVFNERNTKMTADFVATIQTCVSDEDDDTDEHETTTEIAEDDNETDGTTSNPDDDEGEDDGDAENSLLSCIGKALPEIGLFIHSSLAEAEDPGGQIESNFELCERTIPDLSDDDEEVLIQNLVEWSSNEQSEEFVFEIKKVVHNILELREQSSHAVLAETELNHVREVLEPIEGIPITEPVAEFEYDPSDPDAGDEIEFDASASSVADGQINEYQWDFTDDGSTDATDKKTTWTFQVGSHPVTLSVEDDQGLMDTTTTVISVGDIEVPPTAAFEYSPSNPTEDDSITFDATESDGGSNDIVTYEWEFTNSDTVDATGETATHDFEPGDHTVELTVIDSEGLTNTQQETIRVDTNVTVETHTLPEYSIEAMFEGLDGYDDLINQLLEELQNYVDNDDGETRSGTVSTESNGIKLHIENTDINPELWSTVNHFVGEDKYGGEIYQDSDFEFLQSEFSDSDTQTYKLWNEKLLRLREMRNDEELIDELISAFETYEELRKEIHDIALGLYCKPLSVLIATTIEQSSIDVKFETVKNYINSYRELQQLILDFYDQLGDELGHNESRRILSEFLHLETIVVKPGPDLSPTALTFSPLHPLYLWKYSSLVEEMTNKADVHEDEDMKQFLKTAVNDKSVMLPTFTLLADHDDPSTDTNLIHSGYITNSPKYIDPENSAPGSNLQMWERLLNRLPQAHPPARGTLRVTLIDPIAPGELLKQLTKIVGEDETVQRAAIEIAFINKDPISIYTGLNTQSKNNLIEELRPDRQNTCYQVTVHDESDSYKEYANARLNAESEHLILVNDDSSLTFNRQPRPEGFEIHPISVPAQFQYQRLAERFSMTPVPEGRVFVNHLNVIARIIGSEENQLTLGQHNLEITNDEIDTLEDSGVWVCLSTPDKGSSQQFNVRDSLISRQQAGDRDYAIYSRYRRRFVNILVRILQSYDVDVSSSEVENLVNSVPHFEETGLMKLLSRNLHESGTPPIQKGILGAIIATRWLQSEDHPSLVLSIDEPMARQWLNLQETNERADFLLVRLVNEEIQIDIVEAKAHDNTNNVFSIDTGSEEDDVPQVSGKAVQQLETTRQTIEAIFAGDDSLATNSRKEVLRKQIYYALKRKQEVENGKGWEEALNTFFDSGGNEENVRSRIVSVELNNDEDSILNQTAETESGDDIILDRLRGDVVSQLIGQRTSEEGEDE